MFDYFAYDLFWYVYLDEVCVQRVGRHIEDMAYTEPEGADYFQCFDLIVLFDMMYRAE